MVVDDLSFNRTLTRSLLVAADVPHIATAPDVESAWRLVRDFKPDLAVLDWALGDKSGLDLLRRIRTSPDSPDQDLPVLMLTAYREEQRVLEAIAAGTTSYLTKPYTPYGFLVKIRFCLDRALARSQGLESHNGLLLD